MPSNPVITPVVPSVGPISGATPITIYGAGFQAGLNVTFGAAAAVVNSVTANAICCINPAGTAGPVEVKVTNPDGVFANYPNGFTYQGPPSISTVNPPNGPCTGGTTVTIVGANFQPGAAVSFSGVNVPVISVTAGTTILCTTPPRNAITVDVTVVNPDGQSATRPAGFTYDNPPSISTITPNEGSTAGLTDVDINGAGFKTTGSTLVTFGLLPATAITVPSANLIKCKSPPRAVPGTVDVRVTNPDGQTSACTGGYTYNGPPTITIVTPPQGPQLGGTAVVVNGSCFKPGATVKFGANSATIVNITATSINCLTPAGAASGPVLVTVTNLDGQSNALPGGFTYQGPPAITSVMPNQGAMTGGTLVIVVGNGFQPGATVLFDTMPAAVFTITPTSISCSAPAHGAGSVSVRVANPDGQSFTQANAFTYVGPPIVLTVTPPSGSTAGGASVVIGGNGFQTGAWVMIGGLPAPGIVNSTTQITCTTPSHSAGQKPVQVMNPDGQIGILPNGYTYV